MSPDASGSRMPRLVATDLDGTLLDAAGAISPRTRAAIAAVERLGVPVVFVTGRPLRWAEEVFDAVGDHGLAIVSNGALVWDVAAEGPRLERLIDPEVAREVCHEVRAAVPGTAYAVEGLDGISLEPGFVERYEMPPGTRRGEIDDLLDRPLVKLLARHEELGPEEFWDAFAQAAGDRVTTTWSSTTSLVEVSAAGVTKASTLAVLCAELGIEPVDVVAFGDMPNDLPMLDWVGTAYAMENAHPTVRAAADHLAPRHDDDGVARVLTALFGLDESEGTDGVAPAAGDLL